MILIFQKILMILAKQINSKNVDIQNNYYRDTKQPQTGDIDDDDEYNNPNLHSEEQEEFEIPNDLFYFYKNCT
ncbi:unnamed protein product [Rhizophagus irregularis]|nr:unnamed protein product [Rhizophagus irregularis]